MIGNNQVVTKRIPVAFGSAMYQGRIVFHSAMPIMGGYEAAGKIRQLTKADAETIPVIAMTADVFSDDLNRCKASGMSGYIAKPIDPDVLYEELCRQLKKRYLI